ncbi:ribokinase [Kocuria coralli]|uniref:Ribokinase n=1 Tax=Kocuria coralli TaxID=1461025 RepID=A0A5J5KXS9_9MICC|nr:ribokinase [Kocuria coralli]KAA9394228.1 ribokinase [Kocuria coralli]
MEIQAGTVCVVGSLNADLVVRTERHPRPGETLTGGPLSIAPGGKSANQAVAAARLGARVRMVGAVGDDAHGRLLLGSLDDDGVDTGHVRALQRTPTGTAVITVSADGENTIIISAGANGELRPEDVPEAALEGAGALGLTFEIPGETVIAAARHARALGVPVFLNPSPFRLPEPELLAATDVLVVNEHEIGQILDAFGAGSGGGWRERGRALCAATGVGSLVVTLGARGAVVIEHEKGAAVSPGSAEASAPEHDQLRVTEIAGHEVEAVDTTGCGDAVLGALLAATSGGAPLAEATALAMRVAAHAATVAGAQPSYPFAADLHTM